MTWMPPIAWLAVAALGSLYLWWGWNITRILAKNKEVEVPPLAFDNGHILTPEQQTREREEALAADFGEPDPDRNLWDHVLDR